MNLEWSYEEPGVGIDDSCGSLPNSGYSIFLILQISNMDILLAIPIQLPGHLVLVSFTADVRVDLNGLQDVRGQAEAVGKG